MKKWVKGTFSDHRGVPSFKRQLVFLLTLVFFVAIFSHQADATISTLAFLIGGILGITGVEKFSEASTDTVTNKSDV